MRRSLSCVTRFLVLVVLGSAGANRAWAQADEPELGWSNAAELTVVFSGGNADSSTLGFKNALAKRWENASLLVDVSALQAESTTVTRTAVVAPTPQVTESAISTLTAANYYARGQYDRNVTKRTFWFAGSGWERNTFAGIAHRYTANGGVGNAWIDTGRTTFRTSYGVSVTRQDDVAGAGGVQRFAGLRLSYDLRRQLTSNTEITSALVGDHNFDDTADVRADFVNVVTINMSPLLATTVRWRLLFDGLPSPITMPFVDPRGMPVGGTTFIDADKIDTFLTFALVAKF